MSSRRRWGDLPESARSRIEHRLGGPVASTVSCSGGFSPSTAEIVASEEGRRLFVKAVRAQDNPASIAMNRSEAAALSRIPSSAPVPAFVDAFDDGEWFVLVTEAAPGTQPGQPWDEQDLDHVLEALETLQSAVTPCPVEGLASASNALGPDFHGFDRVAEDPPTTPAAEGHHGTVIALDPWIIENLEALREAAGRGIASLDGDTLNHIDLRADNMVIAPGGRVSFVDWAHACRGSRFLDTVLFLGTVDDRDGRLSVSARIDEVMDRHQVPRDVATDILCGFLGFFVDGARRPDPPTVPGLAAHRARYAGWLIPLIRHRWHAERRR